jgi:hypothetical protein
MHHRPADILSLAAVYAEREAYLQLERAMASACRDDLPALADCYQGQVVTH